VRTRIVAVLVECSQKSYPENFDCSESMLNVLAAKAIVTTIFQGSFFYWPSTWRGLYPFQTLVKLINYLQKKMIRSRISRHIFLLGFTVFLLACSEDRDRTASIPAQKTGSAPETSLETIHFFLENSGSMFGYFEPSKLEGPEAFKDLGDVLNNLKHQADTVKTYLISEKVHLIDVEVSEFTDYFQPKKMKIKGEGLTSDITQMFSECIKRSSAKSVSVLVSDGIYSIQNEDILDELSRSSQKTKHALKDLLRQRDFAIAVMKFNGLFNGMYYYPKSGEERINQIRPYYIWIFGDLAQIKKIIESAEIEKQDGYENSAFFFKVDDIECKSKVLDSGNSKIGSFKSKNEKSAHVIEDVEKSERGTNANEFQFGLAVDFGELPLSNDFLENTDNYSVDLPDYKVVNIISKEEFDSSTKNTVRLMLKGWEPTHILEVKNTSKLLGDFNLTLDQNLPSWILSSNSDGNESIAGDTDKTFGFKYLMIDGVFEAFDEVNDHKPYSAFEFKVKP
jgi:hypothetical protein